MPHVRFSHPVASNPDSVWSGFDEALFKSLAPPFMPMRLKRFDGCLKGHRVELQIWMGRWLDWHALIIEQRHEADGSYVFVDKGVKLPWFLTDWQHQHEIRPHGSGSLVVDDITFTQPWYLLLMAPALMFPFWFRRSAYRRRFGHPNG
jgi:ligand-binding SRPBCC domain-containing protein